MANLELIRISEKQFRIISRSNNSLPALEILGGFLKEFNKSSDIKIGIFSVYMKPFDTVAFVRSYQSGKIERMTAVKFKKWMRGKKKQITEKNQHKIYSFLNQRDEAKKKSEEELMEQLSK